MTDRCIGIELLDICQHFVGLRMNGRMIGTVRQYEHRRSIQLYMAFQFSLQSCFVFRRTVAIGHIQRKFGVTVKIAYHRAAVRPLPDESALPILGTKTAAQVSALYAKPFQYLRQLANVTEDIAQITKFPGVHAPRGRNLLAAQKIMDNALAGNQPFIRHNIPWPYLDTPGLHQFFQAFCVFRRNDCIVLQNDCLAVQAKKLEVRLPLHHVNQLVHGIDQPETHSLKGLIPFAIPVGAGKQENFFWMIHFDFYLLSIVIILRFSHCEPVCVLLPKGAV